MGLVYPLNFLLMISNKLYICLMKLIFPTSRLFTLLVMLVFATLIVTSCKRKKEPFPKICPNKTSYSINDTVQVVNCSEDFTKQRWILPDGSTSTQGTVYFVPSTPGSYLFTLFVSNNDYISDYKVTQYITVY